MSDVSIIKIGNDEYGIKDTTARNAVSAKSDKVTSATSGNLAGLDSNGNLTDSGIASSEVSVNTTLTSSDPYTFRQGKGNLADMEIVGASVGWNQLVQNGNFSDTSGWSTLDASLSVSNGIASISSELTSGYTGIYRSVTLLNNHKYILLFSGKSGGSGTTNYQNKVVIRTNSVVYESPRITGNFFNYYSLVFSASSTVESDNYRRVYAYCDNSGNALEIKNLMLIDLTTLFGSATIADAIYAMETAEAGAGVAFFRKYFPKDYYAYDAGSIQSVSVGSRKVVGFNQWDEEWEIGEIDTTTGQNTSASDRIRSKNYIPCIPLTDYYFRGSTDLTGNVYYYDVNKNYLGTPGTTFNIIRTIPNNVRYVRFRLAKAYGTTYKNDICINISDPAKNGTYEPYTSTAYPFDSTKELRGMFSLVDGELKANGDVWRGGKIQRNWVEDDISTWNWTYNSSSHYYYTDGKASLIKKPSSNADIPNIISDKYTVIAANSFDTSVANTITVNTNGRITVTIDTSPTGNLVYELATPTTESAQPYQNPQRAYIDGTEEFTDGLARDVMIPVGNTTVYSLNAVLPDAEDYADGVAGVLQSQIDGKADISALAPSEPGTTASQGYAVGEHFYKDGKFCTVISAIASGVTLTKNTNYKEGTVADAVEQSAKIDIDPSAATISAYPVGTMYLVTQ